VQQSTFFVVKVVPTFDVSQKCVVGVAQATAVVPHLVASVSQQPLHGVPLVADDVQYTIFCL
jgi:phosphoribosylcarboxyaminoimidazole (NCAIR) mutase